MEMDVELYWMGIGNGIWFDLELGLISVLEWYKLDLDSKGLLHKTFTRDKLGLF